MHGARRICSRGRGTEGPQLSVSSARSPSRILHTPAARSDESFRYVSRSYVMIAPSDHQTRSFPASRRLCSRPCSSSSRQCTRGACPLRQITVNSALFHKRVESPEKCSAPSNGHQGDRATNRLAENRDRAAMESRGISQRPVYIGNRSVDALPPRPPLLPFPSGSPSRAAASLLQGGGGACAFSSHTHTLASSV